MIHPIVQQLINYPATTGKKIACKYYNWDKLTKDEELFVVYDILRLAEEIDRSRK